MSKAKRSIKKFVKDPKRMLMAAATGGMSEQLRAVKKGIGGLMGGGAVGGVQLDATPFDISKEVETAQGRMKPQTQMALDEQAATSPAKMAVLKRMAASATGQAPTLAEEQMRAAQERNLAGQMAALQSRRGGNAGATARNLIKGSQAADRRIGQDAAQMAFQERQQFLNQAAQQDDRTLGMLDRELDLSTLAKRSMQDFEKARVGVASANADRAAADKASRRAMLGGMVSGGLGALGTFFASDENLKKDVKSSGKDVDAFLKTLSAKKYSYKDSNYGEGERYGITAQDMEKSNMGKALVKNTPQGKMVDMANGYGAILAAQARLNERLEQIESKYNTKKKKEKA